MLERATEEKTTQQINARDRNNRTKIRRERGSERGRGGEKDERKNERKMTKGI